jgi:hypothetical protein
MIDSDLKPLCDRGHGKMREALLFADAYTHGQGFRCELCGRIYIPLRGYSDWEPGKYVGNYKTDGPRCRAHGSTVATGMYVREYAPDGTLFYACPHTNCSAVESLNGTLQHT